MSIDHIAPCRIWLGGALVLTVALAYHLVGLAQVPPGLDRDAAANGWLALTWLRYGIIPFWIPHASAPEPLIVWMQTATTALLGPSVVALRSGSALFLGLAALAVYLLTLEVARLFPAAQRWWAALLAGFVFACNPLVTQLARTGLRATTLPLLSALFFLFLLRAWRTNSQREYVVSGLVLGVSAYTYLAARFLPFIVLVFVGLAVWMENRGGHSEESSPGRDAVTRASGLALMGMAALIVALPQLVFFGIYPMAFLERAESVTLFANPDYSDLGLTRLLARKVAGMVLMLGVEWSGQYNQAARPLLSPLAFVGLLFSLPVIVRWRRQPALVLMVVALVMMLLPDLIGGDRMQPHELRVIGAFVPIMLLSGVGLASVMGWIGRVVGGKATFRVAGVVLALLIAGWGIVDWFGVAAPALAQSEYEWFARPDVAFAEVVNGSKASMLVPLNDYSRSIVAYLTAKRITNLRSGISANGDVVIPRSERVVLVWPAEPERARVESISYRFDAQSLVLIDGNRAYLMPPAAADVAQLQRECGSIPFTTPTGEMAGAQCELDFRAFNFPAKMPAPTWRVDDLYDKTLWLRSISADNKVVNPGGSVDITSYWQVQQRTHDRWRYFVHILNDRQALVAGDDRMPAYGVYGTTVWQIDEIIPIRQLVEMPDDLAPGRYWIEVGLYDPLDGERTFVSENGADRTLVGPLKVPLQESTALADALPLTARFGDEITLDGYRLERKGGELLVTLRLAALRQPQFDYTLFIHVENAAGELVAQRDAQPRDGSYPTTIWDAGEVVVSQWYVSLPPTLDPGDYRVWMGLYDGQTGVRLPIHSASVPEDAERLLLGEVEAP